MSPHITTLIKKISKKHAVVKGTPFVVLPLELWEQVEDALAELTSLKLAKSITRGRMAHKAGRAIPYSRVRKQLGLA